MSKPSVHCLIFSLLDLLSALVKIAEANRKLALSVMKFLWPQAPAFHSLSDIFCAFQLMRIHSAISLCGRLFDDAVGASNGLFSFGSLVIVF